MYLSHAVLTDVVNQLQVDVAQIKESMDLYVSMTPTEAVETNLERENCIILSGFTEEQVCRKPTTHFLTVDVCMVLVFTST